MKQKIRLRKSTLAEIVAKMKDPDWKRMAEKSRAAIKEGYKGTLQKEPEYPCK